MNVVGREVEGDEELEEECPSWVGEGEEAQQTRRGASEGGGRARCRGIEQDEEAGTETLSSVLTCVPSQRSSQRFASPMDSLSLFCIVRVLLGAAQARAGGARP